MNETVIEAQARYLIEDRIHPTHRPSPPAYAATTAGSAGSAGCERLSDSRHQGTDTDSVRLVAGLSAGGVLVAPDSALSAQMSVTRRPA